MPSVMWQRTEVHSKRKRTSRHHGVESPVCSNPSSPMACNQLAITYPSNRVSALRRVEWFERAKQRKGFYRETRLCLQR